MGGRQPCAPQCPPVLFRPEWSHLPSSQTAFLDPKILAARVEEISPFLAPPHSLNSHVGEEALELGVILELMPLWIALLVNSPTPTFGLDAEMVVVGGEELGLWA